MTNKEVMRMALDALYENTMYSMQGDPVTYQDERNDDAIEALRTALAQPDKEWVGLTDGEISEAIGAEPDDIYLADFRKVEAKLKEKNNG